MADPLHVSSVGELMEKSFYEARPYLIILISVYAFAGATEFTGYASGTLLILLAAYMIRARYRYRLEPSLKSNGHS